MCGHGTIGVAKVVLETGLVPAVEGRTPSGSIPRPAGSARALVRDGHVGEVSFRNVPSFLYRDKVKVTLPELGEIEIAVSYGGDFYIFVEAEKLGLEIRPENAHEIARKAMILKDWETKPLGLVHPEYPEIDEVYGTIVTGTAEKTERGWKSGRSAFSRTGRSTGLPAGPGLPPGWRSSTGEER